MSLEYTHTVFDQHLSQSVIPPKQVTPFSPISHALTPLNLAKKTKFRGVVLFIYVFGLIICFFFCALLYIHVFKFIQVHISPLLCDMLFLSPAFIFAFFGLYLLLFAKITPMTRIMLAPDHHVHGDEILP